MLARFITNRRFHRHPQQIREECITRGINRTGLATQQKLAFAQHTGNGRHISSTPGMYISSGL